MAQADLITSLTISWSNKLPFGAIESLRPRLEQLTESQLYALHNLDLKDPVIMLVVSLVVGCWGVDRFLLGDITLGVVKLLTGGGCGIWWIIDLFTIQNMTRQKNYQDLNLLLLSFGV